MNAQNKMTDIQWKRGEQNKVGLLAYTGIPSLQLTTVQGLYYCLQCTDFELDGMGLQIKQILSALVNHENAQSVAKINTVGGNKVVNWEWMKIVERKTARNRK